MWGWAFIKIYCILEFSMLFIIYGIYYILANLTKQYLIQLLFVKEIEKRYLKFLFTREKNRAFYINIIELVICILAQILDNIKSSSLTILSN